MSARPAAAIHLKVKRLVVFCIGGNLYPILGVTVKESVHQLNPSAAIR
jgi:hypothetical protein